jgi:hypothetical protein
MDEVSMQKEEALKAAALKMTESSDIHQRYVTVLRTVCRCHAGKTDADARDSLHHHPLPLRFDPHNRKIVLTPPRGSWKWKNTNILNASEINCLSALCLFKGIQYILLFKTGFSHSRFVPASQQPSHLSQCSIVRLFYFRLRL